jgi:hypothetical protein
MTDVGKLVRLSGIPLAVAGLLYVPMPFIPGWTAMEDIGTTNWWIVYYMATIHHFLLLFGLFGLFVAQRVQAGSLGLIAFVLASLGNALVGGIGMIQTTILPVFAANPDAQGMLICTPFYMAATQAAQGFIDTACANWNFDVLATWLGVSWLTFLLGSILLGIAIARAGVVPRWSGLLVTAGWLYTGAGLLFPIPESIGGLGLTAIGLGYLVCGASLFMRVGAQPAR